MIRIRLYRCACVDGIALFLSPLRSIATYTEEQQQLAVGSKVALTNCHEHVPFTFVMPLSPNPLAFVIELLTELLAREKFDNGVSLLFLSAGVFFAGLRALLGVGCRAILDTVPPP